MTAPPSSSSTTHPLWGGRFSGALSPAVASFNQSLSFDWKLYAADIQGSIAHATMLGEQHIIPAHEAQQLVQTLEALHTQWRGMLEAGNNPFLGSEAEDIHSFVEAALTQQLGDIGKKLHTGRSRNDQVATDLRLYTRSQLDALQEQLNQLISCFLELATEHLHTILAGTTHLQPAQPVTLAHHLMAYVEMLLRDRARLADTRKRVNQLPLGSGALATSTYPLNRDRVAALLGFDGICHNSLDGVSDRDFVIETLAALSMLMMHLSRLCEEYILWATPAFGYLSMDDGFSTGSSMMPQKKNPDVAELVRGKSGRVYGHLMALLTTMKALPLAYNKDMQEDKEALFDALETTLACVTMTHGMMASTRFHPESMEAAAEKGFINATELADYLVKKGEPFRDAHHHIGQLVQQCLQQNCTLKELPIAAYQALCPAFDADLYDVLDFHRALELRTIPGSPNPQQVLARINTIKNNVLK